MSDYLKDIQDLEKNRLTISAIEPTVLSTAPEMGEEIIKQLVVTPPEITSSDEPSTTADLSKDESATYLMANKVVARRYILKK